LTKSSSVCNVLTYPDLTIRGLKLLRNQEEVFALRYVEMVWILGTMNVMTATTEMEMAVHLGVK
jgi:hypothetical protein